MRRPTRLLALSVGGLAAASSFFAVTHRSPAVTPVAVSAAAPAYHPSRGFPSVVREELTTTTSTTVAPSRPAPRTVRPPAATSVRSVVSRSYVTPAGGGNLPAVWRCIGHYESGNNPAENTGNGYYGEFQFLASTWDHVMAQMGLGYRSYPYAAAAPEGTQLAAAEFLQRESGWGQWSTASRCGV